MRQLISVKDIEDFSALLKESKAVKKHPYSFEHLGKNKTMGILFFNSSLRTRMSTHKAAVNMGMDAITINVNEDLWKMETEFGVVMNGDKAEHIKEAAGVIGRYCDIIGIRAFASLKDKEKDYSEHILSQFIKYSGVPIISLESATAHPLQAFADIITIEEHKKKERPKVVMTWAPHPKALPHAVPNSFAEWSVAAGYDVVIAQPEGYELDPKFTQGAKVTNDQKEAFKDADFIYAKNWSSYSHYGEVLSQDLSWTVDGAKMALTNDAKFMHCLPVRRNMIVTDEVIDSPNSIVLDEAANRVVSAQTVIKHILSELEK